MILSDPEWSWWMLNDSDNAWGSTRNPACKSSIPPLDSTLTAPSDPARSWTILIASEKIPALNPNKIHYGFNWIRNPSFENSKNDPDNPERSWTILTAPNFPQLQRPKIQLNKTSCKKKKILNDPERSWSLEINSVMIFRRRGEGGKYDREILGKSQTILNHKSWESFFGKKILKQQYKKKSFPVPGKRIKKSKSWIEKKSRTNPNSKKKSWGGSCPTSTREQKNPEGRNKQKWRKMMI